MLKVKRITKLLALVLVAVMLFAATACNNNKEDKQGTGGKTSETNTQTEKTSTETENKIVNNTYTQGFPLVKDPITLRAMTISFPHQVEMSEMKLFKEYEKMTNVKIEWEVMPSSDLQAVDEKLLLSFQSGNLPDIIMVDGMMNDQYTLTYGPQGLMLPINKYLDFAPNMKAVFEKDPSVRKAITCDDGNIYGIPSVSLLGEEHDLFSFKMYMNNKWLENLGLEVPDTLDDLFSVLRAFKTSDPNGNGQADEVPVSLFEFSPTFALAPFGGPVYYYNNDYMTIDDQEKVLWGPTSQAFKNGMKFMNQLYAEGLLDQDFMYMSHREWQIKIKNNKVGMFMSWAAFLDTGYENYEDYVMVPPIHAEGHNKTWTYLANSKIRPNYFVITSSNKYPEASVRWADYFWSSEGEKNALLGPEGERWKNNGDGTWTDFGSDNMPQEFTDVVKWMGTLTPGYMLPVVYQKETQDSATKKPESEATKEELADKRLREETLKSYAPYKPKFAIPYLMLKKDEVDLINQYKQPIHQFYVENLLAFVRGEKKVDAEWDNYISELKKRGLDDYTKIYQDAYNRYKDN